MRDLKPQWHEQLCCNNSIRWHGPGKHINIDTNRLRRDREQHKLFVKKVSWQWKGELMPNRSTCSFTSLVPQFSRLKRTAHRQKKIQICRFVAYRYYLQFPYQCNCIVRTSCNQCLWETQIFMKVLNSCTSHPSPPSARSTDTHPTCICIETQSQTLSLTAGTCNNFISWGSSPECIARSRGGHSSLWLQALDQSPRKLYGQAVKLNKTQR